MRYKNMSKGEKIILQILQKANLPFTREKTFSDLKMGLLRFDFYIIYNNSPIIIEYDGEQHFKYNKKFFKTNSDWLKYKENDRRKNSYCLANNIKCYRIPFWEISHLSSFSDLINEKFLVISKWHNDNLITQEIQNRRH